MTTNVLAEKLKLIEWLIHLQDLKLLEKIKTLKEEDEIAAYEANLRPMTREELTARANASNQAIEEGRVSDIESILNEKW